MKVFYIFLVFVSLALSTNAADNFLTAFGGYESKINKMINDQINTELVGHYTYLHLSHLFNDKSRYYPKVAKYFKAKSDEEMSHAERFMEYQNQRGAKIELSNVMIQGQFLNQDENLQSCKNVKTLSEAFECAVDLEVYVTDSLTDLAREASDVKPTTNTLKAGDVNDLLKSQAVLVIYEDSNTTHKKSLRRSIDHLTEDNIRSVSYFQLAEMITHEFLGHQMEDTKEIANYYSTLSKFGTGDSSVENLGSYLFDKNL